GLPRTRIQWSVANRWRRRSVALARGLSFARGDSRDARARVARPGAEIKIQTSIILISEDVEVDLFIHSRTREYVHSAVRALSVERRSVRIREFDCERSLSFPQKVQVFVSAQFDPG